MILPLAGKLSDHYGRRTVFLASISLFTIASLSCGLAQDIYWLIGLRAIQAIGGAAFMPSATGIVVDHFGDTRDRAVGLFTSIIPVGAVLGPVLGGVFVEYWSWRGIFLVNVPIGAGLLIAARACLPIDPPRPSVRTRLDVGGMLLLALALSAGMVTITSLGDAGAGLASITFLGTGTISIIALLWFLLHSRSTPTPFIPVQLLRGRGFGVMNLINFFFGATAVGLGALIPFYATSRYQISSLDSGTLLSARAIGMITVAAAAAIALRRTGYRIPMLIGFIVTAVGLLAMSAAPQALAPYAWLSVAAGITGIGMGLSNPAAHNASLQLDPHQAGAIAGLRGTFRQTGAITAISITTTILARSHDPALAQAHVFAVSGIFLLLILPLIFFVPEHRGTW